MKVLFSGEGPTDLGTCLNGQGTCAGIDFGWGPMTVVVTQLAEMKLGYSLCDYPDSLHFISESALAAHGKSRLPRLVSTRGKKKDAETSYYYVNAMALGGLANELEADASDAVVAVLFRDCDGTRSEPATLWSTKWRSMVDGFARSGHDRSVPMLPKPKSEAWLLSTASTAQPSYADLEDISGNDNSPNSAKRQLAALLDDRTTREDLCDWLEGNPFNVQRASTMPSFAAFRVALDAALDLAMRWQPVARQSH